MSSIPSIKRAQLEAQDLSKPAIACVNCKALLWLLSDRVEYGTKVSYKRTACKGVKEYDDVWKKDGNGNYIVANEDLLCPFCGEPHTKAVQAQGRVFPIPHVIYL